MTEGKFEPGDVVMLRSGGPEMTVLSVNEAGMYTCIWIEKNKKYTEDFPEIVLQSPPDFTDFFGSV